MSIIVQFRISWRQPNTVLGVSPVIHGLSRYNRIDAEKQVTRFLQTFPRNRYFVEQIQ